MVGYQLGMSRGLSQAQAAAATAEGAAHCLLAPTATHTATATATNTPRADLYADLDPHAHGDARHADEWAQRYLANALEGLNTLAAARLQPGARPGAWCRRLAQEAGMSFVPVSYFELVAEPWAAFVAPRTPDGAPLPMLLLAQRHGRQPGAGATADDATVAALDADGRPAMRR